MVRVWKTKSPLFCLRYDPLIVFRRKNHTTFIFIKRCHMPLIANGLLFLYFFQACEQVDSSKSCDLIGSESGLYFTTLSAYPGGIFGSFIHKFVCCLWMHKNRHFQTLFLLKLALLLALAREKWISLFRQKIWRENQTRQPGKGARKTVKVKQNRWLVMGVCKTRTGYLRVADADGKMRIEKCGWKKKMLITKKVRGKKTRNADGRKKKNKQTNKGKKSFFKVAVTYTWCTSPLSV